LMKPRTL